MTGTTKGTGGDIIILEEAAYVDPGFFYETVAPLLLVGVTSLICISTLTSEIKSVFFLFLCFYLDCFLIFCLGNQFLHQALQGQGPCDWTASVLAAASHACLRAVQERRQGGAVQAHVALGATVAEQRQARAAQGDHVRQA